MTTEEFSNQFDVLVDSYRRFKSFDQKLELDSIEFNEYEKSVYLTQAQESIVQDLYRGTHSSTGSFEATEELRRKLDALIVSKTYTSEDEKGSSRVLSDRFIHTQYTLPKGCWYIIYEQATFSSESDRCANNSVADVIPVTHDEYQRTIHNPFRGPNKRKILRLDLGDTNVELISSYNIKQYTIRYIKKPNPIIVADLSGSRLYIEGESSPQTCQLSSLVHQDILSRAVQMALSNRINNTNKNNASR